MKNIFINKENMGRPIILLSRGVRDEFKRTLNQMYSCILEGKKISIYFDTCFLMRDYFYDVYRILKNFLYENNLPEDSVRLIILDQVRYELTRKAHSTAYNISSVAKQALEYIAYDESQGHIFTYEKTSERRHYDTVLLKELIDVRQDRKIVVFTNDNNLKNDLLMMNYLSSSIGESIATVYISPNACEFKYQYPEMAENFYEDLSQEIYQQYQARRNLKQSKCKTAQTEQQIN